MLERMMFKAMDFFSSQANVREARNRSVLEMLKIIDRHHAGPNVAEKKSAAVAKFDAAFEPFIEDPSEITLGFFLDVHNTNKVGHLHVHCLITNASLLTKKPNDNKRMPVSEMLQFLKGDGHAWW